MKKWFLNVNHIPVHNGADEGPGIVWAHGKGDTLPIPLDELTSDWLMRYGFNTRAAATRALRYRLRFLRANAADPFWREESSVEFRELPDNELHYKIYRCYEIVILDKDGNEVGDCNYCYGTKEDAEEMARHELKIAELSR